MDLDSSSTEAVSIENYEIRISRSDSRISMCICIGFFFCFFVFSHNPRHI